MDFSLSEEQELFQNTVRDFVALVVSTGVGGGIVLVTVAADVSVANSTISGNSAGLGGGGVGVYGVGGVLSISGSTVSGNATGKSGGGVYIAGVPHASVVDSTVSGNTAAARAGGVFLYNASSLTATLMPNAPLAAGTTYRATVLGGATDPRVKDVAGNALAANVTWTFTTTAPSQDTTPPTITTVTPKEGSTGVNRNTKVTVRFSEPLDASSVTTATVALRDASNQTVTATVSLDSTRTIVTLDPVNALASRQTFTATVVGGAGGVRDLAGNTLSATKTWTFTTR